nr:fumarylacetoacetase [Alteromonas portus]
MVSDTDTTIAIAQPDETHDEALFSWLKSANQHPDFPIQNLPMGVFKTRDLPPRCGVAIGDEIIDLAKLATSSPFDGLAGEALSTLTGKTLNPFIQLPRSYSAAFRLALSRSLRAGSRLEAIVRETLISKHDVEMCLPCSIGDYTDFYTSIHHATAVGKLFRPDNPLLPNYKWLPIGYHGRASSVVVSGQQVYRPNGQVLRPNSNEPVMLPSEKLDYEAELGIFIGCPSPQFSPLEIEQAEKHFFGVCMLNDWSARDIQAWEYQPLGPFLSKNFVTSISPWIVTAEALIPFRVQPTKYSDRPYVAALNSPFNTSNGGLDIQMRVSLRTAQMKASNEAPVTLSKTSFKHAYWTVAQMISHHTTTGCNLNAGDLFGSGTQSGPEPEEAGSLLELTEGGKKPLTLPNGEQRTFLEDGDEIILSGFCISSSGLRIGIGNVSGQIASTTPGPGAPMFSGQSL